MRASFWATIGFGVLIAAGATALYGWPNREDDPNGNFSRIEGAESAAGKNDTAPNLQRPEVREAARTQQIEHTTMPVTLTQQQKERLRTALQNHPEARRDEVGFTLSIGAGVPKQVELAELPSDVADILHGYTGDKFVIVRGQLVVVDNQERRIVALIPDAG